MAPYGVSSKVMTKISCVILVCKKFQETHDLFNKKSDHYEQFTNTTKQKTNYAKDYWKLKSLEIFVGKKNPVIYKIHN